MDALTLLREQASNADELLIRVFTPVTPEQGAWLLPGSTANTIGATFLHTYYSEDEFSHRFLGTRTLFEEGDWQQRLGYDPKASWTLNTKPETSLLLSYAAAVTAATKHYLTGLAPQALEQENGDAARAAHSCLQTLRVSRVPQAPAHRRNRRPSGVPGPERATFLTGRALFALPDPTIAYLC